PLRARFIEHFAPLVRDVVIAGADRDEIAALVFPDVDACAKLCAGIPGDAKPAEVLAQPSVRRQFAQLLARLAASSPGSSTRVCRLLRLAEPPSMDVGEMTDKGSINQRAVLRHRCALVEALYALPPAEEVITIEEAT